ncbi:MAG: cytidylate kinase-like family protein [Candidatus Lernaella stagnicola]|nr:cytidylate kinase-like family protein [Candidatus Lernaella stagnicola]
MPGKNQPHSFDEIVNKQIRKWNLQTGHEKPSIQHRPPVICISREAGSGGNRLAHVLADALDFDLFDQALVQRIADSAKVSAAVVASVDERWRSVMEDWMADWSDRRHLWLDDYLKHLLKVLSTIGQHGHAVVVGRGGNFVLNRKEYFYSLRIRVIAPIEQRIQKIASKMKMSIDNATKSVNKTDADRKAFIRKYFNEAIDDPANYDLVINTGRLTIEDGVEIAQAALGTLLRK